MKLHLFPSRATAEVRADREDLAEGKRLHRELEARVQKLQNGERLDALRRQRSGQRQQYPPPPT